MTGHVSLSWQVGPKPCPSSLMTTISLCDVDHPQHKVSHHWPHSSNITRLWRHSERIDSVPCQLSLLCASRRSTLTWLLHVSVKPNRTPAGLVSLVESTDFCIHRQEKVERQWKSMNIRLNWHFLGGDTRTVLRAAFFIFLFLSLFFYFFYFFGYF